MSFVGLLLLVSSIVGYIRAETIDEIDKIDRILKMEKSVDSELNQGECQLPNLPVGYPEIMKFYKPVERINCGSGLDWIGCEQSIC